MHVVLFNTILLFMHCFYFQIVHWM